MVRVCVVGFHKMSLGGALHLDGKIGVIVEARRQASKKSFFMDKATRIAHGIVT